MDHTPSTSKPQAVKTVAKASKEAATPEEKPEYTGALELVNLRNNFYRDNYRNLMLVCLGLIMLAAALVYWALYERTHKPPAQYFATTYDGKLIPLIPLSEPSLTDNALLQWVTEAAVNSYTFNYVNYRKALQDVRIYFTQSGYQFFLKALSDSNNINAVRDKKLIVSAAPTGAPLILKKGLFNNELFIWDVQLPMEISFRSANDIIRQNVTLNMRITRVPTLESPSGVGIATYVLTEGKTK